MRIAALVFITFFGFSALAEYRAFELLISDVEGQPVRKVVTTMDHIQYPRYYPLNPRESISYVDSWMCWEATRTQPVCANPTPITLPADDPELGREPASD